MTKLHLTSTGRYDNMAIDVEVNTDYIKPEDVKLVEVLPNRTMTSIPGLVFSNDTVPCQVTVRDYNNHVTTYKTVFNTLNDAYYYASEELECFALYGDGCLEIIHAETGELLVIT